MKLIIGTQNKQKVAAAEVVLRQILNEIEFNLSGIDVPSGYGETPIGEETKLGAFNRATAVFTETTCDWAIGIESGLVERYQETFEEAWCCIRNKAGQTYYGYSSGLRVPDVLLKKMKEQNLEHFEVLRLEEIKQLLPVKKGRDTWANYSALMLMRTISFEEALRNTLVQIFAPEESLYHK